MSERGFTLAELLVASLVTLTVLSIAVGFIGAARTAFERDEAGADLAQRLRIGLQVLADDVRAAGAGAELAGDLVLADSVPVVEPLGDIDGNPAADGAFHGLRLLTIPAAAGQGRLREATASPTDPLRLMPPPLCPAHDAVCGFAADEELILFDATSVHDFATVADVDPLNVALLPESPLRYRYREGAFAAVVEHTVYGLAPDESGGQRLVKRNAAGADMPLLDHVVDFEIDAYGAALPPALGLDARRPSYGPRPPPPGEDDDRETWGPGESCTIAVTGAGARVPRLPALGTGSELVRLAPEAFNDGPWCPDAASPNRFDADLLRIRRIDLRIRVEAANPAVRGASNGLFRRPGSGTGSAGWVPDGELRLSIVPRNLAR